MKKSILILLFGSLFTLLAPTNVKADSVFEIAGNFRCDEVTPQTYRCVCEPPYNKRCIAIVIRDNGTIAIEFGSEDPNNISKFNESNSINATNVLQTSSGTVSFTEEK
ncbi:MAG: hypothetical protein AB7D35_06345 [Bacteroidales bacterium]|jgi:hypothetical protein